MIFILPTLFCFGDKPQGSDSQKNILLKLFTVVILTQSANSSPFTVVSVHRHYVTYYLFTVNFFQHKVNVAMLRIESTYSAANWVLTPLLYFTHQHRKSVSLLLREMESQSLQSRDGFGSNSPPQRQSQVSDGQDNFRFGQSRQLHQLRNLDAQKDKSLHSDIYAEKKTTTKVGSLIQVKLVEPWSTSAAYVTSQKESALFLFSTFLCLKLLLKSSNWRFMTH